MNILIITGMSGSGKSIALRSLEDDGWFCVDNIIPELIADIVSAVFVTRQAKYKGIGIVIDIRAEAFLSGIFSALDKLRMSGIEYKLVFIEADNASILKRYKETRRNHPLNKLNIAEGIDRERIILQPIKDRADIIIDSSGKSAVDFKVAFMNLLGERSKTVVIIKSFGYKKGILNDADFVFDARMLKNPYYEEDLKKLTGQDERVKRFVLDTLEAQKFVNSIADFILNIIPSYEREVKNVIVVGIGCTGGKHRSVAVAEKLGEILKSRNIETAVQHRDIT